MGLNSRPIRRGEFKPIQYLPAGNLGIFLIPVIRAFLYVYFIYSGILLVRIVCVMRMDSLSINRDSYFPNSTNLDP